MQALYRYAVTRQCVVANGDEYIIVEGANGHYPNCQGHLPHQVNLQDYPFIKKHENGSFYICLKAKSSWMKEQIKNGNAAE